ncbi:MAG: alkaline phosphatase [Gallionellaceae bacterium]|nr:MAG: alkaline phosphatase [Gallionellaceae bacterium]
MSKRTILAISLAAIFAASFAPGVYAAGPAKNIIFFLGDGMGPAVVTAARIYKGNGTGLNEKELLTFQTLDRTARIKTYSHDGQTTDSAPSMAAYMTGVKADNEVISMSANTIASGTNKPSADPTTAVANAVNNCAVGNGTPVTTILELAKANGKAVGSITTTELTHATPAATYAHICNRNAQYHIAAQLVPNGTGYNTALTKGTDMGVDVLMGGGLNHFTPYAAGTNAKGRADGRDLTTELAALGYTVAKTKTEMAAAPNNKKFIGLYSPTSHLAYELDRKAAVAAAAPISIAGLNETVNQTQAATQPSLSEMTVKSIQLLSQNANGFFLMVEGGRIDHALHGTNAKRALEDTVAFDNAIAAAITEIKKTDPTLANTMIVVTADHDHTMTINGYGKIGNPILDINRSYTNGLDSTDINGVNYTTLVFGNGPNRSNVARTALTSAQVTADGYLQETGVRMGAGGETHGGGDVMLYATGAGAQSFKGTMDNTQVFSVLKSAFGF